MFLLAITMWSFYACASDAGKQWYKPGDNYTVAEFERDQTACTKNRVLDEACLRARGWTTITADDDKGPSPILKPGTKSGPPRY
jgi:hypothetical protein